MKWAVRCKQRKSQDLEDSQSSLRDCSPMQQKYAEIRSGVNINTETVEWTLLQEITEGFHRIRNSQAGTIVFEQRYPNEVGPRHRSSQEGHDMAFPVSRVLRVCSGLIGCLEGQSGPRIIRAESDSDKF